jgi:type I restriction enzyme S subunit
MSDVMAEFHDGPHATPPPAESGPVFLGIKNITDSGLLDFTHVRHIAEQDYDRWTRRVTPQPDDVVFTYEATLHRYALIPDGFRGCLGRRLALIRPNRDVVLPRFLHFVMLGPRWRQTVAERVIAGSTVDRIPLIEFPRFPIELPDLVTQQAVLDVLGAIDDLIGNNGQRIVLLEKMAQEIFREWFVFLRYPGHEGDEIADSDFGPIPSGWRFERLNDLASIVMGQSPKSEYYNDAGDGLPFHQGVSDFGAHYPRHRLYCSVDGRLAETGDLLVSVRAPVGRLNRADQRMVIGRGLPAVRSLDGFQALLGRQLRHVFHEEDVMGGGTIFKAITKSDLEGVRVIQPNADVGEMANARLEHIDDLIRTLTFSVRRLSRIRDLLLPKLVTGGIDVSRLEFGELLDGPAA